MSSHPISIRFRQKSNAKLKIFLIFKASRKFLKILKELFLEKYACLRQAATLSCRLPPPFSFGKPSEPRKALSRPPQRSKLPPSSFSLPKECGFLGDNCDENELTSPPAWGGEVNSKPACIFDASVKLAQSACSTRRVSRSAERDLRRCLKKPQTFKKV